MASVTGDYQFSSEPRAVKGKQSKYRDDEVVPQGNNIMFDKRVVRGNTYAAMIVPASAQDQFERQQKQEHKRKTEEDKHEAQIPPDIEREGGPPEPIENREHKDMQTDEQLEELFDKPVEYEIETQTDYYMDRPPTPLFLASKRGEDHDTQVEDGELFHFNSEVDPILEVLVTKSVEQARMEVLEEEELQAMATHMRDFEQKRVAELNEVQRLEAEELRKSEEAESRKLQARTRKEQLQAAHQKYVARIITKLYLGRTHKNVIATLLSQGAYGEPAQFAFHGDFIPWVLRSTAQSYGDKQHLRALITVLVQESYTRLNELHKNSMKNEALRRQRVASTRAQQDSRTEQKKKERVVLRGARQRKRDLEALRAQVQAEVVAPAVAVEKVTSQRFSDIDARQTEAVIGTPGGLFGELVHLFSALEKLKVTVLSQDETTVLLHEVVSRMRVPVLVFSDFSQAAFNSYLKGLQKKLDLEGLPEASEEVKQQALDYLADPQNASPGTSLALLRTFPSAFAIRQALVEQLITAFFTLWIEPVLPSGLPNTARPKLELKGEDFEAAGEAAAVVRVRITMVAEEPPEAEEDSEPAAPEFREIEPISDSTIPLIPHSEGLSVFVIHQAPQRFLRRDLVALVRTVPGYEALETDALFRGVQQLANEREQLVLRQLAKELPVLDFEFN